MRRQCEHRKLKKNYPFGKESVPRIVCKSCGKIIKLRELLEIRRKRLREKEVRNRRRRRDEIKDKAKK